jgi:hypothetical protein
MSSHRLLSSFSEQSYGLDRHYTLPGSFSEQISDTNNGDFLLANKMVDKSRKNVLKLTNQSQKRKSTGQVLSLVDVNRDSRPSQKRYCNQFLSSSEAIAGLDPAVEVIDLTIEVIDLTIEVIDLTIEVIDLTIEVIDLIVNVEHCAICSNVLRQG